MMAVPGLYQAHDCSLRHPYLHTLYNNNHGTFSKSSLMFSLPFAAVGEAGTRRYTGEGTMEGSRLEYIDDSSGCIRVNVPACLVIINFPRQAFTRIHHHHRLLLAGCWSDDVNVARRSSGIETDGEKEETDVSLLLIKFFTFRSLIKVKIELWNM